MSATSKDCKETKEKKDVVPKDKKRPKRAPAVVKTEPVSRSSSPESKRSRTNTSSEAKQNAKAVFFHEENTIDKRDAVEDLKAHGVVCDEFKRIINDIKIVKDKGLPADEQAKEIEELRIQGCLYTASLRRLNRFSHFRCKKIRDATQDEKQKIDTHNLQLQNLLYEVNHLQKEINKCLQFKSNDEDVNLVSVADFYKEAPSEITKPEATKKDLHQQTLARLDWELTQRKRLNEKLKERQNAKTEHQTEIQIKEDFLDSLQPQLNTILDSTKPVQTYLGMPFDEIRQQHQSAAYLPRPLYVLFMQTNAYKDVCDKNLLVSIEGEVEEAKSLDESNKLDLNKADEDSDSETEETEKEQSKKRHRRNDSTAGKMEQANKEKLLKKHPLRVVMVIKCKDGGASLQLTFHYLMVLEIVTLTMKLTNIDKQAPKTVTGGDLLTTESLLNCIYPDDFGNDTPNASNKFALQRFGLGEFSSYITEAGHPYHWVQWLCGLQFLTVADQPSRGAQPAVSATHMEDTIRRLRKRLRARLSLQHQLASLEHHNIPMTAEYIHMFPAKICARLSSWKRTTYEDFIAVPYCASIHTAGLARDTDMYFTATMERGSAKLTTQVVVPSEYPVSQPLFAVCVTWKADRNNLNDTNIRDLESEVNVHYADLLKDRSHDQLLTNQVQRLLMCFDVYLETEAEQAGQEGPTEFSREKIFPRTSKGPHRSKPYYYNSQLGFFGQR